MSFFLVGGVEQTNARSCQSGSEIEAAQTGQQQAGPKAFAGNLQDWHKPSTGHGQIICALWQLERSGASTCRHRKGKFACLVGLEQPLA